MGEGLGDVFHQRNLLHLEKREGCRGRDWGRGGMLWTLHRKGKGDRLKLWQVGHTSVPKVLGLSCKKHKIILSGFDIARYGVSLIAEKRAR